MYWEPGTCLAQSQELGTRKMNKTQFLPRGVCALTQALGRRGSSGNILTFDCLGTHCWVSEDGGIVCGSEPLIKYTCRSKFRLAVICMMPIRRVFFFLYQSCKGFKITTCKMEKSPLSSTAIGDVNFTFRYQNCSIMSNSLQPRMISMFTSKWMFK